MTSPSNSPTARDTFLALRYKEILEAVLDSTKDCSSSSKKTANSVIQEMIRPNVSLNIYFNVLRVLLLLFILDGILWEDERAFFPENYGGKLYNPRWSKKLQMPSLW